MSVLISQHNRSGIRNPWVLGILAMIAAVLVVNGVFIWLATHDRSSLVDREYKARDRKTGAEFLSGLGAQQALGWQVAINRPRVIVLNEPTGFELAVVDRDGKPVSGEMQVEAYRAADASRDFTTRFPEVSIGNYHGFISFPLKGSWELHISVKRGNDVFAVQTDRLMVAESR